jgi:hypothetical protein
VSGSTVINQRFWAGRDNSPTVSLSVVLPGCENPRLMTFMVEQLKIEPADTG